MLVSHRGESSKVRLEADQTIYRLHERGLFRILYHWHMMVNETCPPIASISLLQQPALPTEIWLHILEQGTIYDAVHLWTSVRLVSHQFKDFVERLFMTVYLPKFSISLALPRRDPGTGALKWHSTPIPRASITMSFDHISADQRQLGLKSPSVLKDKNDERSVEELRNASILPIERLEAAPTWVQVNNNAMMGASITVPKKIEWDDGRKVWTWQMDWRTLVSQYYQEKARTSATARNGPRTGYRWGQYKSSSQYK